ncbi:4-hydroxyproline epimerase [Chelativorans sp. AA-79]|uniref:4-hydroxyproline epimerase n=1 Tax=Chelativorans sp. AA-79 TaxID=3028735 RepID=UPI0023F90F46|nr:4-hydroxyproline epimerase [Chelativorans sp. AA-79]WEX10553.1 4-hydroxyproline epimerase [Chelativorans sp. AA-79]
MARKSFFCIDAHTCGNPVRVIAGGGPDLKGDTMNARREHFVAEYDWIRTGLMFEPRGHDVMSGSILYPALRDDVDGSILFIETSGCLPMCGHGTIGTVTVMIEEGLVTPSVPGRLRLEVPAGIIEAEYEMDDAGHVTRVKITNVPSFLYARNLEIDLPGVGPLKFDVAYGGNFYAIFEPQPGFEDMSQFSAFDIQQLSPVARHLINEKYTFQHPEFQTIKGLRHVMWTGTPKHPEADARNAVFYGEKAIDRSPCGTGTSARMAQKAGKGELTVGDSFVHESIIGSLFWGKVEAAAKVGEYDAIVPSVAGQAWITGYNTIFLDDRDPFVKGFTVE